MFIYKLKSFQMSVHIEQHGDLPSEEWDGEGGGRGDRDGEHM